MTKRFAAFGFPTTHDALEAERVALGAGLEARLIPAPAALGSLCGLALRVAAGSRAAAAALLAEAGVPWNGELEFDDRSHA